KRSELQEHHIKSAKDLEGLLRDHIVILQKALDEQKARPLGFLIDRPPIPEDVENLVGHFYATGATERVCRDTVDTFRDLPSVDESDVKSMQRGLAKLWRNAAMRRLARG